MDSIVVAMIASLAPTFAIVANYLLSRRDRKKVSVAVASNASAIADNAVTLDGIHVLVNSRLSQALTRIASLEKALGLEPNAAIPLEGGDSWP